MTDQFDPRREPPKDTQFKPGVSGNPRGRPKGTRNLRTDLEQLLKKPIAIRENGKRRRISSQEAMLLKLYEKVTQGDTRAIKQIIDLIIKFDPKLEVERPDQPITDENDKAIAADFLRRHQPIVPGDQS